MTNLQKNIICTGFIDWLSLWVTGGDLFEHIFNLHEATVCKSIYLDTRKYIRIRVHLFQNSNICDKDFFQVS